MYWGQGELLPKCDIIWPEMNINGERELGGDTPAPVLGIVEIVKFIKDHKEDVQALDAAIPLLSRKLLYENPSQEDEVAGYSCLRVLVASQPDPIVKDFAQDALELRWIRVGFYDYHTPGNYTEIERRRSHFDKPGFRPSGSSGVSQDSKVAVLELARVVGVGNLEPITIRRFGNQMVSLLGIGVKPTGLTKELRKLYVLSDEGQFVPLVEVADGKIRMTSGAYRTLAPHLAALEAISYPQEVITERDKKLALAVKGVANRALRAASRFFTRVDISGLTLPEQPNFLFADVSLLEAQFRKEMKPKYGRDVISLLDEDGTLFNAQYHEASRNDSSFYIKQAEVKMYRLPENARGQLLFDFWGQQFLGEQVGRIFTYERSRNLVGVEVVGVFMSILPSELQGADSVDVSSEEMNLSWIDISGKGGFGTVEINYKKQKAESRETYVSGQLASLSVPIVPKGSQYRRTEEVQLDKDEETREFTHTNGKYSVSYKKLNGRTQIVFKGTGWESIIFAPHEVDVLGIAQGIAQKLREITGMISDKNGEIAQQVARARYMSLVEHRIFNSLAGVTDPERRAQIIEQFRGSELFEKMRQVDEELAKLNPETQYYAKYYIQILVQMGRMIETEKERLKQFSGRPREDQRKSFRSLMRMNGIIIPERLLTLCEEIFTPTELQDPPE